MTATARIIVDLGYGDSGKGSLTDFFCRDYDANLVVRFNGGPQAAHNVVTDDGRHHVFAQFGSGSFVPGVRTLISQYMWWDPIALAHESAQLSKTLGENALDRLSIDERAPVITPYHVAANRIHEWMRGDGRHGSCGKGHGEAVADSIVFPDSVIRAYHLVDRVQTIIRLQITRSRKIQQLKTMYGARLKGEMPEHITEMWQLLTTVRERERIADSYYTMAKSHFQIISPDDSQHLIRTSVPVFEGAQGVLLDEWYGFHPYTTWSTTTQKNAIALLGEAGFAGKAETTGIIRAYATRHGAGPFVTEGVGGVTPAPEEHNGRNEWQGSFRTGCFDAVMLRYAAECTARERAPLTNIALSHLDLFDRDGRVPYCAEYVLPSDQPVSWISPLKHHDLERQETLQKELWTMKAGAECFFESPTEMIRFVAHNAGAPVRYTSFGPRSSDKRALS